MPEYYDRIWETGADQRDEYQRDRDRILYCDPFRRLVGVTQVVSASEGHVFHNRLTHSLQVAQIARRLAERLRSSFQLQSDALGDINPDVAEAAALAHDLGHPPFGHVAEKELDRLVRDVGALDDGFEGNAQSFRSVTKLAVRQAWSENATNEPAITQQRGDYGLNLTRATLNAILKYPWKWGPEGKASRKWGAYDTETAELDWARELGPDAGQQSIEAAIMDWSDDIAYSLHDTDDFYRAGLIPLNQLSCDAGERTAFLQAVFERYSNERRPKSGAEQNRLTEAFNNFCDSMPIVERYTGTPSQRMTLHAFIAHKIGELITATELTDDPESPLLRPQALLDQVEIVKQLVWHYVIVNPALATQQHGHVRIIRWLFDTYLDASTRGPKHWRIMPPRFRQVLEDWRESHGGDMPRARLVRNTVDTIASFTDLEAVRLFQRLSGIAPGSVLDMLPS